MKKRIFVLIVCLLGSAWTVAAQKSLSGEWDWKGTPDANKTRAYFSIGLHPKNGKLSGTMVFNDVDENGDTDADGAVVPFVGTINGDVVMIEFDPEISEPGYVKTPHYKKPKGKLPATATLKFKNGKLEWTQTRGSLGAEMPSRFVLTRVK